MIELKKVRLPEIETDLEPVMLTDETMDQRIKNVLEKMKNNDFDSLVIYADLEHGNNFEYLTGFLPRFEEAMLVLHKNKEAYMVLGNENLNKCKKSRIKAIPVHMPHFSLPNQPMNPCKTVSEILAETKIHNAHKIGLVGWKNFTSKLQENDSLYDLPHYIVESLKQLCPKAEFKNATYLFIGEKGVRTVNNANEFAHYEFGAALAGNCILKAMDALEEGSSEMEIAEKLDAYGQTHSVITIMATGERFEKANMYPSSKRIKRGDTISITTGFKGGLQSRAGYAVSCADELPDQNKDYLEKVAKPYFNAVKMWLEKIKIGMSGDELYNIIEKVLPKEIYRWSLNPGHLCADEEWLSSPVYPQSTEQLRSGMLFQIDIIPSVEGYGGISCESGVLLADEGLRKEIEEKYPVLWKRIKKRRNYIQEELGIKLSEEILPTSSATVYCRPFLLNKDFALKNISS